MTNLPEQPEGSPFSVSETPEGLRVSWEPRSHLAAYVYSWAGVGAAASLVLAAVYFLMELVSRGEGRLLEVVVLSAVAAGELVLAVALRLRQGALARETLEITQEEILHLPAWYPGESAERFTPWQGLFEWLDSLRAVFRQRERRTVRRGDVRDVRAMGRGRFRHVAVVVGASHLNLGRGMSDAEQEWLAEVLRRWLAEGRA
jgi:hypothetical protein